ncbi:uncharacterized protein KIAA1614 homolog [Odontesthes bonariensis]|uniref:uncharacterized protein KIAA1614 homolog n=1 Tax=Odontesthes bonariensis TaxID=219752 RepID=UPI003F58A3AF
MGRVGRPVTAVGIEGRPVTAVGRVDRPVTAVGRPVTAVGIEGRPVTAVGRVDRPQPEQRNPGVPVPGQRNPGVPVPGHRNPGVPVPGHRNPGVPVPGQRNPGVPVPGHRNPGVPVPGHRNPGVPGQRNPGVPVPGNRNPGVPDPGHRTQAPRPRPQKPRHPVPGHRNPGVPVPGHRNPGTPSPATETQASPSLATETQAFPTPATEPRHPDPGHRNPGTPSPATETQESPSPATETQAPRPRPQKPRHPVPGHRNPGVPGHRNPGVPVPGHKNPGVPVPGHRNPGVPVPGHRNPGVPVPGHRNPGVPVPGHRNPGTPSPATETQASPSPATETQTSPSPATETQASPSPTTETRSYRPAQKHSLSNFGDGAPMKRRCFPLRGDHSLLTPDPPTQSGVRLREQVWSEGVASPSGHLSDSASGSTSQFRSASLTRRLRFEDETEMEVESRYQERQQQRRRAGQRGGGVLLSKPDLNLYVSGRAGWQQRGRTVVSGHRDLCGTVLGGRVHLDQEVHVHLPVTEDSGRGLNKHRLHLRTEPLRETYIGCVTPTDTAWGGGGACQAPYMQVRRRANQLELNGTHVTVPQAPPPTDLPTNPYAPYRLAPPLQPSFIHSPILKNPSPHPAMSESQVEMPNGFKVGKNLHQNREVQGRPAASQTHRELRSESGLRQQRPCVEATGKNSSSSTSGRSSELKGENQAPPTSGGADGQVRQPMSVELHRDNVSHPEHFSSRDEPARLSLRHLLSSVRLSRTRTGSLDRLTSKTRSPDCDHTSKTRPPDPDHASKTRPPDPDHASSGTRKSCSLLRKSPSLQSLCAGSPIMQLRKSSSVQSFGSEQKKKNRSDDYRPAVEQFLPRGLSIEDVGHPYSVRSVGRVLQVCSDGTFLVELNRPTDRTYGFIISRGRGRSDSGVYVEEMVDSSTEKLYAGLLAAGDEILEVNGEKVAGLSLDQVTLLLVQNASPTVRILQQRRASPR